MTFPAPITVGPYSTYRCGDLAAYAGMSPGDVLEMTYYLAMRWEHADEQRPFQDFAALKWWLRRACHGNHAADVLIVCWKATPQMVAEALEVDPDEICERTRS